MIRRVLPHLSVLAVLGALVAISLHTLAVLDGPRSPIQHKLERAERVLAYRVTAARGPRFLLDGGRQQLRLSSVAVVPPSAPFDASRELTYTFALAVHHDGRELWHAELAVTSRQSKLGWTGTEWAQEGAWSLDGTQLTDERLTTIDLPEVPVDAVLEVRLVGTGEALARVFRFAPRDVVARERAAVRLDPDHAAELLRASTYLPWPLLDPMEQEARLTRRWQRLPATGEDGVDFETRALFVSEFRTPRLGLETEGFEIARGRAAVVNVMGPVRLHVEPVGGAQGAYRIETRGTTRQTWLSPGAPLAIDVAAGPTSVILTSNASEPRSFQIHGDQDRWLVSIDRRVATPGDLIVPTRVRIPVIVLGPTTTAAVPAFDADAVGMIGQILRVDARILGTPLAPATITATFRAADGAELSSHSFAAAAPGSVFERLDWQGTNREVSEPSSVRIVTPPHAARIELTADHDVAIVMSRWLPGELEREPPYAAPPSETSRWRYAPLQQRIWFSAAPANYDELARAGRVGQLEAQVRIEPNGPDDAELAGADEAPRTTYETLPVVGAERQRAREPVATADAAEVIASWPAGALGELRSREPRIIELRAAVTARPRVYWLAPASAVGTSMTLTIDGNPLPITLATASGSMALSGIAPGRHRVVVDAPSRVHVWINRPPVDRGGGLVHERTLYRITGRPARIFLRQRAGEQIHLYAIVYAPQSAPTSTIRIAVDGGRPKRRAGIVDQVTAAELITALPPPRGPAAKLVDLGGRSAGAPRVVHFGLLDDLAPGQHRIDVAVVSGSPVWIRVVATRHAPGAATIPRTGHDD